MNKSLLALLLFSVNANASWLCREAASKAENDYFYACGHSINNSLNEARSNSRKNAQQEFKAFCDDSEYCRDHAFIVTPLRTDCFKNKNRYECYRGLQYRILPTKRSSIQYDKDDLNKTIKAKQEELEKLQENLYKIQEIEKLNTKIEELKKIDQVEADIEQLKSQTSNDYENMEQSRHHQFSLSLQLHDIPFEYDNQSLYGIGFEYTYNIFDSFLYLTIGTSYLFSSIKEDTQNRGSPNTYSDYQNFNHKGYDIYLSTLIKYKQFSLIPEFGHLSVDYKSQRQYFNSFGVANNKEDDSHNFSSSFNGIHLRYGKQYYIQYGYRKFGDETNSRLILGISSDF